MSVVVSEQAKVRAQEFGLYLKPLAGNAQTALLNGEQIETDSPLPKYKWGDFCWIFSADKRTLRSIARLEENKHAAS